MTQTHLRTKAPARPRGPLPRLLRGNLPYQLLTFAVFATVWEVYGRIWGSILLPPFSDTAVATVELLGDGALWKAFWLSNQALVLGFAASVVIGVPVGLMLGRFPRVEKYTDIYLSILVVLPMAGIIPLLIMSVGFGLLSRVILVTLFAVVMVIVNARVGIRQIDPSLVEMARTYGASELQIWRRILIPGALPAIMTGVRLGLGRAVTGMVIVELLMVSVGFGGLILEYRSRFDAPELYATIVIILVEALLLIAAARWAERKAAPWAVPKNHSKEQA